MQKKKGKPNDMKFSSVHRADIITQALIHRNRFAVPPPLKDNLVILHLWLEILNIRFICLTSLCPISSIWFSNMFFESNKKNRALKGVRFIHLSKGVLDDFHVGMVPFEPCCYKVVTIAHIQPISKYPNMQRY